ncbi:hypothetical protein [Chryseosolibacter indicus]|uniref:Uncharacterized protein n=1 Tax=Chryseosolibacter indicus TaxID=2782351 RepID=A0ABS5VRJ6_9BACT|nr:hypothetical protein [Chryseosolibacter indicus]MBT1704065.1 hypothetical protein [Chryseosolibacter indicus]
MKTCLIFLVSLTLVSGDFPKKGYDRVLLYQIEEDEQSGISRLLDAYGNINSKTQGIELNLNRVNELVKILNDTSTYGARHSYSHSPTIGLIFYKKAKIIDWVEIALPTNSISSKSKIKNEWKYYEFLREIEYPLTGLSPLGRQKIRQWIKEIGINDEEYHHSTWDSVGIDYSKIKRKL